MTSFYFLHSNGTINDGLNKLQEMKKKTDIMEKNA
jgi:hypothetical protein